MSYTQAVDEVNEALGYDADITDERQRCKHGTFIGSWWGPDHLCHYCEMGYDTLTPITFVRVGTFMQDSDGHLSLADPQRSDYPEPRFLNAELSRLRESFAKYVEDPERDVTATAYRAENGVREVRLSIAFPDKKVWGHMIQLGRRSVWTA